MDRYSYGKMLDGEREKLLHREDTRYQHLIGQNQAVDSVACAIRRSHAGLSDPNKPIGSFLFLEPTGVGKTELCKALATFLFDTSDTMVRIDMSEFMEKHAVARLIGAPQGYVGYAEGGYLTEAICRKLYSVILLDEIEKAHVDVFNILLQVMDEGRLTDSQGHTVDFRHTVIVMTSNLGTQLIQDLSKKVTYDQLKEGIMGIVSQHFRPEFINQIDDIVIFQALNRKQIAQITNIQLVHLHQRLQQQAIKLQIDDAVLAHLAAIGFDPRYGARPLKRVIQQRMENPLAQSLLTGYFKPGDTSYVSLNDNQLHFSSTLL